MPENTAYSKTAIFYGETTYLGSQLPADIQRKRGTVDVARLIGKLHPKDRGSVVLYRRYQDDRSRYSCETLRRLRAERGIGRPPERKPHAH